MKWSPMPKWTEAPAPSPEGTQKTQCATLKRAAHEAVPLKINSCPFVESLSPDMEGS